MEQSWHDLSAADALHELGAARAGLSEQEVDRRREVHGRNVLREKKSRSVWSILLEQFKSVVIIVLLLAGVVAVITQKWPESVAIAAVIAVNAAIGFFSEWKATRSMEALRQLGEHRTRVRRNEQEQEIPAADVVPGDVILLGEEEIIPADARLIAQDNLRVNEAPLTGESAPVDKQVDPLDEDVPLAERTNLVFKGTTVVKGHGTAVVFATGMATEVGQISEMASEAESESTPLQKRLDRLGRRMAIIVISVAAVIAGIGLLAGRETTLMIESAIALGVAAIPEGLPIVATIALARGMWLMARHNAIVNRLPAVETLGATTVIFSDKTGTLTQNRMQVVRTVTAGGETRFGGDEGAELGDLDRRVLENAALCNEARRGDDGDEDDEVDGRGDPMEVALLRGADELGIDRGQLADKRPRVRTVAFERDTLMMATYHENDAGLLVAVKGAPQAVFDAATHMQTADGEQPLDEERRQRWQAEVERLAGEGLRLLAVAEKRVDTKDAAPYEDLRLLGLVGLHDPPREDVRHAIDTCQAAGIRVEMVTGDQPRTAEAIAEQVGIVGGPDDPAAHVIHGSDLKSPQEADAARRAEIHRANIFARVTPRQKLNLVELYQDAGEVVAMTGDGINDAPALKKADIGVAMGKRGTDAAKQVADMILTDDALGTIVAAVRQGRIIFGNIRKSVLFMLCTNGAEVLAVAIATLLSVPLPLLPLQILYLNVLTDVFPALALGVGPGPGNVMQRKPRRRDEAVLTRSHWLAIGGWSVVIAGCVLAGLFIGLRGLALDSSAAVTISFMTLGVSKLWFVFNLRDPQTGIFRNEITRNPWIWGALAFCAVLLVAAVYLPGLSDVLRTEALPAVSWGVVLLLSLVPLAVGQVALLILRRRESDSADGGAPAGEQGGAGPAAPQ